MFIVINKETSIKEVGSKMVKELFDLKNGCD
jgi:hypothetical protein